MAAPDQQSTATPSFDQVSTFSEYATVPTRTNAPRFIVAVDYGTTYSGVAWVMTDGRDPSLERINIYVVDNWPAGIDPKVPSKFTYSANEGHSFGHGIGDNAYVLQWTKLDLIPPTREKAMKSLHKILREARQLAFTPSRVTLHEIPRHLIRTTEDVVTDYLINLATALRQDFESKKDPELLTNMEIPMEIVITTPAVWDRRAKNITYRAVRKAFLKAFPEIAKNPGPIRMATEPEACAQYTMKVVRGGGVGRLNAGECFIVVDAGGGTVDLVSYYVHETEPRFRVERMTDPSSDACGATRIDDRFLHQFLLKKIGDDEYRKLEELGAATQQHAGGSHTVYSRGQKAVLANFEIVKRAFEGPATHGEDSRNFPVELPQGVCETDIPANNIRGGTVYISESEMEDLFSPSVDGTITLISRQLMQLDTMGYSGNTSIFLSGGFSESEYLRRRVEELARQWRFNLFQAGDKNERWTAVARGACIMGLGISCELPPPVKPCPFHIGVVVSSRLPEGEIIPQRAYTDSFDGISRTRDTISWIVPEGDLISHAEPIDASLKVVRKVNRDGNHAGSVTVVTTRGDTRGVAPSQLPLSDDTARGSGRPRLGSLGRFGGQAALKFHHLQYDLSEVPRNLLTSPTMKSRQTPGSGRIYDVVQMLVEVSVSETHLQLDLTCGRTPGTVRNGVQNGTSGYRFRGGSISVPLTPGYQP